MLVNSLYSHLYTHSILNKCCQRVTFVLSWAGVHFFQDQKILLNVPIVLVPICTESSYFIEDNQYLQMLGIFALINVQCSHLSFYFYVNIVY